MLDPAIAYNRFRFLGREFLTWLWFKIETDPELGGGLGSEWETVRIGRRIVLEKGQKERISIRGDAPGLEEARLALRRGALVAELHLIMTSELRQWQMSLNGDGLHVSGLKISSRSEVPKEEIEVTERIHHLETVFRLLDTLYGDFIRLRTGDRWEQGEEMSIRRWITCSQPGTC